MIEERDEAPFVLVFHEACDCYSFVRFVRLVELFTLFIVLILCVVIFITLDNRSTLVLPVLVGVGRG